MPIEPDELVFSFVSPIRYFELFTPPLADILNLVAVRVAAVVVASVHPKKLLSKPAFDIRLELNNLNFRPSILNVSPELYCACESKLNEIKTVTDTKKTRYFLMIICDRKNM